MLGFGYIFQQLNTFPNISTITTDRMDKLQHTIQNAECPTTDTPIDTKCRFITLKLYFIGAGFAMLAPSSLHPAPCLHYNICTRCRIGLHPLHHRDTMADDLKDLRSQLGMTQQQLADALGVGLRTLKGYESADAAPPMALLACRHLLSQQQRMPQDGDGPIVTYESGTYQPAVPVGLEERLAALEADMTILGNLSIEERLNALEAKAKPHRPRFAPDVQALQDKEDARVSDEAVEAEIARYAADGIKVTKEDIAGIRLQLAKRAELEDAEGDDEAPPAVPINRPWNTYRPPELTPAEEAAKKAQRAATKAAHIANGEPWD